MLAKVRTCDDNLLERAIELPTAWIDETLAIYRQEWITIQGAEYRGDTTQLQGRSMPYPFTKPGHIEYITASMAAMYVAQAGYIHLRAALQFGTDKDSEGLSSSEFFKCRDEGNIIFSKLNSSFRKKISIGIPISLRFRHTSHRRSAAALVSHFEYAINGKEIFGDGTCFMVLAE